MNEFLSSSSSLNHAKYFRLIALASMDVLLTVPLGAVNLYVNIKYNKFTPWPGWKYVHSDFSYYAQVPTVVWSQTRWTTYLVRWSQWSPVVCAAVFFAFFGFATDVREGYRDMWIRLARKAGFKVAGERSEVVLPAMSFLRGVHAQRTRTTQSQEYVLQFMTSSNCVNIGDWAGLSRTRGFNQPHRTRHQALIAALNTGASRNKCPI